MFDLPLAIDSDPAEYPEFGGQGLVNCFVVAPDKTKGRRGYLKASAGLTEALDTAEDICRGLSAVVGATPTDDVLYAFHEGETNKVTWDGSAYTQTAMDVIPGSGRVWTARNAAETTQVGVVSDAGVFYIIEDTTITAGPVIDDVAWNSITFASNHVVLGENGGKMYATKLLDMSSIGQLDFATAESDPDGLVAVSRLGSELIAFGRGTVEAWYPNGESVGFPFTRRGASETGCLAKFSIQRVKGSLVWVSNRGDVSQLVGYQAQRISNAAVERAIADVSDPESIESYTYTVQGRTFYGIVHPNFTWELNIETGLWQERRSYEASRWRVRGAVECFGKQLAGDYLNGKIWEIDPASRVEGSDPVVMEYRSPPIDASGQSIRIKRIEVDAVTGRASNSQVTPTMLLDHTKDGHSPWSNERFLSLGAIGDRGKVLAANRLGTIRRGQSMTIRLRCSDDVTTGIAGVRLL